MRWASALVQELELRPAVEAVERALRLRLGDARPDLLVVFASPHLRPHFARLPGELHERLAPRALVGCVGAGVIGDGQEVEQRPALSVTAAVLPRVELRTFHVGPGDLPDLDRGPGGWRELVGVPPAPPPASPPHFVLLCDGATFDPRDLLQGLDFAYPGGVKIGGLASGRRGDPLFVDRGVVTQGAVGVALQGDVAVDAVVAQGCRGVGAPMTVTRCHDHVLEGVDGRPPLEVLSELYEALSPEDQELLQHSLHLGIASTSLQEPTGRGDYLIRNVLGADPERGALAVGALLRPGQTVRFFLRDAAAAEEDLREHLDAYRGRGPATPPAGALLFSCTGRGRHLFGAPNHDSSAFRRALGDVPLGGFFCGGEIGPVGDATHLHGYTSSFGIFRPAGA
ncbi:MAG: FIST C-terminal domain-containing protein [Planctomycetes bacterium]|nr:FIST C-terminal domain-containing protein [Planctomycetota bacterium]